MGCFLACFRVEEEDRRRRSRPKHPQNHYEPVLSHNPLSSLFTYEDIPDLSGYERLANESDDHRWKNQENHSITSPCIIGKEIIDEAKFLKACGTIQETPAEIRKAMKRLIVSSPDDTESDALKVKLGKPYELPSTPAKLCENLIKNVNSPESTPSSCRSSVHNTAGLSATSSEGSEEVIIGMPPKHPEMEIDTATTPFLRRIPASEIQIRQKSVRFKSDNGICSTRDSRQCLKNSESPECQTVSRPSPYPTPMKLSDDMQTPGTLFPASVGNLVRGKARIRSQYVYPDLNPAQNLSQWKALKDDEPNVNQFSRPLRDSLEQPESNKENAQIQLEGSYAGQELGVEASLSSWLRPPYRQQNEANVPLSARKNEICRTPGDRPILGLVAVHWNEDEYGNRNSKGWDGNGIPNTTNKYKEDQKVRWHATPFEERLAKALSEESSSA